MTSASQRTEIILLAAGASSRMAGLDKLLLEIDHQPLLRRSAQRAMETKAQRVHVALQPDNLARISCLASLEVNQVFVPDWALGMAASLRAGMAALSSECTSVIIALADMPNIETHHFDSLIRSFDPEKNHEICRNCAQNGAPGLPVLFGRRFFEAISALKGDNGAKAIISASPGYVFDLRSDGSAALDDIDTIQDWESWQNK